MKSKIKEMIPKAKSLLSGSDGYMPAKVLAEQLGMTPAGVYRVIRALREGGHRYSPLSQRICIVGVCKQIR